MVALGILDDHLHAVGMGALNAIARRRVPNARLGELGENGDNLHRAGALRAQAPLSDVAVMANPGR